MEWKGNPDCNWMQVERGKGKKGKCQEKEFTTELAEGGRERKPSGCTPELIWEGD
jgi:hypothetical protein